jgi:hypothetical protein
MRDVDDPQPRLDSKHDPLADRDRAILHAEIGQEENRCRLAARTFGGTCERDT